MDDPTVITGLPERLRVVPPSPAGPDDPERHAKRAAWLAWRGEVKKYRTARQQVCATDKEQQQVELRKCADDRAYFLTIWCVLHEPRRRKNAQGQPPFIPFEKQVQLLRLLDEALHSEEGPGQDLVVSKCRDVGATWVFCTAAVHDWLFEQDSMISCVSYKEEFADSPSMKSVFGKIRHTIFNLPPWMAPDEKHRYIKHLLIKNKLNGNEISADSTTPNFGVGDRGSWALLDEFAKHQHGQASWGGSTDAFDTRVACSTECFDYGTFHRDLWKGKNAEFGMPKVLEIDWWDNPTLTDEWFENRRNRDANDPVKFSLEVLRNPYAGSEVFVYPEAREARADSAYRFQSGLPIIASLDPGKRDDFAVLLLQDDPVAGTTNVIDAYAISGRPADYFGSLLTGKPDHDRFFGDFGYDAEALRIMEFMADKRLTEVYGDVAGRTQEGRLMESTYDVLAEYGIHVIFDRTEENQIAQSKKRMNSHKGRHEATHALWPRVRFADTPGSIRALDAISKYRFKTESGTENPTPRHDEHSHYATALEYFAVNRAWQALVNATEMKAPKALPQRRNWLRTPKKLPTLEQEWAS